MVALSDAWQKGAQQLSVQQRRDLANDPRNLQAVDGPTNERKSDGDAATWLPPNKAYRCTYVTRQIQVKSLYRLWVTAAEKDAMTRILTACGAAAPASTTTTSAAPSPSTSESASPVPLVPSSTPTTTPEYTRPAAPVATQEPAADSSGDAYYANCSQARAAGAAPLYRGQPGYRSKLDRDGDGVACE